MATRFSKRLLTILAQILRFNRLDKDESDRYCKVSIPRSRTRSQDTYEDQDAKLYRGLVGIVLNVFFDRVCDSVFRNRLFASFRDQVSVRQVGKLSTTNDGHWNNHSGQELRSHNSLGCSVSHSRELRLSFLEVRHLEIESLRRAGEHGVCGWEQFQILIP